VQRLRFQACPNRHKLSFCPECNTPVYFHRKSGNEFSCRRCYNLNWVLRLRQNNFIRKCFFYSLAHSLRSLETQRAQRRREKFVSEKFSLFVARPGNGRYRESTPGFCLYFSCQGVLHCMGGATWKFCAYMIGHI